MLAGHAVPVEVNATQVHGAPEPVPVMSVLGYDPAAQIEPPSVRYWTQVSIDKGGVQACPADACAAQVPGVARLVPALVSFRQSVLSHSTPNWQALPFANLPTSTPPQLLGMVETVCSQLAFDMSVMHVDALDTLNET